MCGKGHYRGSVGLAPPIVRIQRKGVPETSLIRRTLVVCGLGHLHFPPATTSGRRRPLSVVRRPADRCAYDLG
jgi:hypothetical protein